MKIGGKVLGFVGACSLTTLVVAGVSVATLQSFDRALATVESASSPGARTRRTSTASPPR